MPVSQPPSAVGRGRTGCVVRACCWWAGSRGAAGGSSADGAPANPRAPPSSSTAQLHIFQGFKGIITSVVLAFRGLEHGMGPGPLGR